jgi:hypothetical protein
VTGGSGPGAGTWREASGRVITWAVLRVVASIAVVTALYYLLPFDGFATGVSVTLLVAGLVVFVALVAFQVRASTAKTETARLVVTGQMIADLVILGLAIKAITSAVRRGRQRQPQDADRAQVAD